MVCLSCFIYDGGEQEEAAMVATRQTSSNRERPSLKQSSRPNVGCEKHRVGA